MVHGNRASLSKRTIRVITFCATLAAPMLVAQTQTAAPRHTRLRTVAEQIFKLDGTREAFDNAIAFHEAAFEQARADPNLRDRLSSADVQAAAKWIHLMFGPDFADGYMHGFLEAFDETHARTVLQWLESSQVRKFSELERVLTQPGMHEDLNRFLNSSRGWPAQSERRKELLKRFAEMSRCPEDNLDQAVNTPLLIESVRNQRRPPEEKRSKADFQRIEKEMRDSMREGIANGCWWPLLYVYRDVSDDDLERYLAFYETDAGKWYRKAHRSGSHQAYFAGAMRVAQAGFDWPSMPETIRKKE